MATSERAHTDPGVLVPVPRGAPPRVIGPGRLERGYRERIARLERELDTARLVERGAERRQDRLEEAARESAAALAEARQLERRLILALGALQGENAELRRRAEAAERALAAPRAAALPPAPHEAPTATHPGLLARLRARRRPRDAARRA